MQCGFAAAPAAMQGQGCRQQMWRCRPRHLAAAAAAAARWLPVGSKPVAMHQKRELEHQTEASVSKHCMYSPAAEQQHTHAGQKATCTAAQHLQVGGPSGAPGRCLARSGCRDAWLAAGAARLWSQRQQQHLVLLHRLCRCCCAASVLASCARRQRRGLPVAGRAAMCSCCDATVAQALQGQKQEPKESLRGSAVAVLVCCAVKCSCC